MPEMPEPARSTAYPLILVTARALASRPLIEQLAYVLDRGEGREAAEKTQLPRPQRVILREKDLSDEEYSALANEVRKLCQRENVTFMWQSHVKACPPEEQSIQMSMGDFLNMKVSQEARKFIDCWVSVHSVDEAIVAEKLGATALIYGHVYETECKAGLEPRGLEALRTVIEACNIPVYAIGGIRSEEQFCELEEQGSAGACIMSEYMTASSSHTHARHPYIENKYA